MSGEFAGHVEAQGPGAHCSWHCTCYRSINDIITKPRHGMEDDLANVSHIPRSMKAVHGVIVPGLWWHLNLEPIARPD